jgi:hypothetical protein
MARTPDHMAGIKGLPKWNPANPTSYSYDPTNYDPADYAAFKAARLAKQGSAKTARKNAIQEMVRSRLKENFVKRQQGKKQMSRADIDKAVKAHKTLHAELPSTCFASLTFKDGIATAKFYRGGAVVYEYPMELDDFLDWAKSDSLGEFFNAEVR